MTDTNPQFPQTRMRRPRLNAWSRQMVKETHLTRDALIWPLFVREGGGDAEPIATLPGVARHSVDGVVEEAPCSRSRHSCYCAVPAH